jgi:surface carbohydrate biosynthesis protein
MLIENTINPGRLSNFVGARRVGRTVSAWCEEGLVYKDAREYCARKVDAEAFALLRFYFAWGRQQMEDMVDVGGCDGAKIVPSGNPRFDPYRPELRAVFGDRVARIKQAYAPFVLVNTSFPFYSNYFGTEGMIERLKGFGGNGAELAAVRGRAEFQAKNFAAFEVMVAALAKRYPEHRIVVRPHPSESHDPWLALAGRLPNVAVRYEGNVAEWLLAADASIHNNCTTAIEAYLLGRLSVGYSTHRDEAYDLYLPSALSAEAATLEELLGLVEATLKGQEVSGTAASADRAAVARRYIANATGATACDAVLDKVQSVDLPEVPLSFSKTAAAHAEEAVRRSLRPLKRLLDAPQTAISRRYTDQKFACARLDELRAFLNVARRVTGRFSALQVVELQPDTFCIYR